MLLESTNTNIIGPRDVHAPKTSMQNRDIPASEKAEEKTNFLTGSARDSTDSVMNDERDCHFCNDSYG